MSEPTYQQVQQRAMNREINQFENDRRAQAQAQIDFVMELKLIELAMARRDEIPERGYYNPFSRERVHG